ncbi:hypothetical protein JCM18901_2300 [Psychrobacter sp. JCM 18901]|nr:hypothetical protein JCM18901_2300 [Psychrobacter sp. JCM 18901]
MCLVLTACNSQTPTTSEAEESDSDRMNIVSPDWGNAATLTAMGHAPIATGDVRVWDRWVGSPKLPASITDLGIRYQPTLS